MQLSDEEEREIEEAVDRAFLRLYGRTYREPEVQLMPEGDSLEKILKDFPSLFGDKP